MRDKDTKILEEKYKQVLERDFSPDELHSPDTANNSVVTVFLTIKKDDDVYDDVPVEVEFDIYRGSTPAGGDDPRDITITNTYTKENLLNSANRVIIPAGTSLEKLEVAGFTHDSEELNDSVYDRVFNS